MAKKTIILAVEVNENNTPTVIANLRHIWGMEAEIWETDIPVDKLIFSQSKL